MSNIIHQMQPTDDTCASACLAMIINEPVEKVIEEFHKDFFCHETSPSEYLTQKLIRNRQLLACDLNIFAGHTYLTTVPSLNYPGLNHYILIQQRRDHYNVFDPNMGRAGKKYYIPFEGDDIVDVNQYRLRSFTTELEVRL